ncbi:MAG: Holliday junction resolvase RuvX [Candidatus Hodgkinia cicadicola]
MKRTHAHNIQQQRSSYLQNINIIGLDIGREVGITKATLGNAIPVSSLSLSKAVAYVTDAAGSAHTPTLLVVGYPITLYGKRAAQARAVDALVQMLRMHLQVPIILWDERLSTKWGNAHQHTAAATKILQSFLKFIFNK